MALVLEPLSNAELVLSGAQEAWLLVGMITALSDGQMLARTLATRWFSHRKVQAGLLTVRRKMLLAFV